MNAFYLQLSVLNNLKNLAIVYHKHHPYPTQIVQDANEKVQ